MALIGRLLSLGSCLVAVASACPAGAQNQGTLRAGDLLSTQLYAVGGVFAPLARSGSVTAVDMMDVPGATSGRSGGASSIKPLLGARVHVPLFWYMRDEQHLGLGVFVETGLQSGFGRDSFNQSFQNTSATAADFGSRAIREYFQIPVLLGVTVPVGDRSGPPAALFDIYGGLTLDSWSQVLQGGEANAPGQQGFYGENRRFSVDPTVGLGLRIPVGNLGDGLPLLFGLNAELQFRPGSVVTAISNNFAVTYVGTADPQANLAIMARLGIAFGSR
ncbi:MAG: hypothetical protein J0J01_26175 [Reyranella sp.]|uniref:hypothetical protein n=1 Tax=Reyranella sp. TaxID=1929291 RepID=UPI001AD0DE6B|nr:hypothetical protein [Reyranella sp.]MBN9090415.1 hypothetical protein [Reyranella sp.]